MKKTIFEKLIFQLDIFLRLTKERADIDHFLVNAAEGLLGDTV